MYIDDFVWLTEIANKVATKHHVTPDKAEEVFFNNPKYRFVESGNRLGEDVYSAGGQTEAGRYLIVFFIYKGDKYCFDFECPRWTPPNEEDMSENNNNQRSGISNASSSEEIGEYWDDHSLADHWDQTHEVEFEIRAPHRITLEPEVYARLEERAESQGISLASLANSWLKEKLAGDKAA